ncbi:hypothetical protein ACFV84_28785 [Kitasatospora sp. NPDC059811]|uniref:hypothetical protein n=1 Tax=Streptomycetaceae TaxID=2062 RepID=UPI0007AFC857|nr:hypothetical protein [Streptomyces sp. MJM8645]
MATARGAVALDNLAPIALLLTQWRHSAEVHADPALLALITREPDGDLGPAAMPEAAERAASPSPAPIARVRRPRPSARRRGA